MQASEHDHVCSCSGEGERGSGHKSSSRGPSLLHPMPSQARVPSPVGALVQGLTGFCVGSWLCHRPSVHTSIPLRSHSQSVLGVGGGAISGVVASPKPHGKYVQTRVYTWAFLTPHLVFFSLFTSSPLIVSGIVFLIQRPVSFTVLIRNRCRVFHGHLSSVPGHSSLPLAFPLLSTPPSSCEALQAPKSPWVTPLWTPSSLPCVPRLRKGVPHRRGLGV